ncbi:hypothetical protein EVAR_82264_1 [Eumeta japonica]|uniref:Uncharacterized protein n=1 Tax=Eumeta variegata TaxID=151549 RepID=A0A4C1VZU8_EUMVA|nr:hypothetical protein EVAR_82264_1 [Eumeta japonica]
MQCRVEQSGFESGTEVRLLQGSRSNPRFYRIVVSLRGLMFRVARFSRSTKNRATGSLPAPTGSGRFPTPLNHLWGYEFNLQWIQEFHLTFLRMESHLGSHITLDDQS